MNNRANNVIHFVRETPGISKEMAEDPDHCYCSICNHRAVVMCEKEDCPCCLIKVGDRTDTVYFGVRHAATIVQLTKTRARLEFYNCENELRHHWRKLKDLGILKVRM